MYYLEINKKVIHILFQIKFCKQATYTRDINFWLYFFLFLPSTH